MHIRQLRRRRTSAGLARDEGLSDSGVRPGDGGWARMSLNRGRSSRKSQAALAGAASAAVAEVEHPPPANNPAAAAFFDVDNTLMRGASIYHFARGLAARKMFGPMDLARMAWGQACYRMRGAENADHIDAAREAALAFVAGHRRSEEHTSELQSHVNLVCRLLLEKKKK